MRWGRPFNPSLKTIWVAAKLFGPKGLSHDLQLVVDPGTPITIVAPRIARRVNLGREKRIARARFLGVTGRYNGYVVRAPRFEAFGRTLRRFKIACCPFPKGLEVDGLLGLDFFENLVVTLDFKQGLILLED